MQGLAVSNYPPSLLPSNHFHFPFQVSGSDLSGIKQQIGGSLNTQTAAITKSLSCVCSLVNSDYLFLTQKISMLPDGIIIHFCVESNPTYLPGRTKTSGCCQRGNMNFLRFLYLTQAQTKS